jgi:4-hydroxy-2-oxoheptanedioate aldolase
MRENRAKRIINEGGLALGTGMGSLADPAIVEIIGLAGFDAVFIDMEHSALSLQQVQEMTRAADLVGITPVVRTPGNNPNVILQLLDFGVQGIQVPHITNRQDALAAVKAVRYPPLGERGVASSGRAARYGAVRLPEHVESSNREIMLSVMIEDMEAVNDIEGIANTDGIDLISIGPNDLARALGVIGQPNHPKTRSTVEMIAATVKRVGKNRMQFPLMHPAFTLDIPELRKLGVAYTHCAPAAQTRLMRSYQEQVKQLRAAMGQ